MNRRLRFLTSFEMTISKFLLGVGLGCGFAATQPNPHYANSCHSERSEESNFTLWFYYFNVTSR